jgi:hypothetical protein
MVVLGYDSFRIFSIENESLAVDLNGLLDDVYVRENHKNVT